MMLMITHMNARNVNFASHFSCFTRLFRPLVAGITLLTLSFFISFLVWKKKQIFKQELQFRPYPLYLLLAYKTMYEWFKLKR